MTVTSDTLANPAQARVNPALTAALAVTVIAAGDGWACAGRAGRPRARSNNRRLKIRRVWAMLYTLLNVAAHSYRIAVSEKRRGIVATAPGTGG